MVRYDARKETYEEIEIFDTRALFSAGRIQKDSLPEGFYCYEVRHDDECIRIPCELSSHILVNFWRTVISRVPLIKEKECRRYIDVDQHIIIWHFRRIKLCRNNAGIFHPRTPGILVITVIEKIITVITRLKMGYFNFPDSANYGIK